MPMKRRRRLIWKLALLGAATLVALVSAEVLVRFTNPLGISQFHDMQRYFNELCQIVGPPRILKHRHNADVEFFDFSIRTNRLGLRGPELPATKPDNERRLLFLGDSVVLGWGANEDDLFVTRCENQLNAAARRDGSRLRYRCINAGHNQFDTTQEAALLADLGPELAPDAVCLVYVGNDVIPTIDVYEAFRAQPPPSLLTRAKGTVLSWFRGLHGISVYFDQIANGAEAVQHAQDVGAEVDSKGWKRSRAALLQIRDWCKQKKVPFVVLDHTQPAGDGRAAEIPPLSGFLAANGISRVPFHFTREELARPIRHSACDPHPNALGHELLLRKLGPALELLGLPAR